MDFVLSSPKCPKWPKESRENSFHGNSIKILPNIIKCWLLKSFGLMLLLIEKFITHTSSASISNPHKNTKARPSKSKTCESGKMNPKLH